MSNNAELYSHGGHLSTVYLHKFFKIPLFGTLTGMSDFPSPLPGKMHKRKPTALVFSREMIAFGSGIRYTMAIPLIPGGAKCI